MAMEADDSGHVVHLGLSISENLCVRLPLKVAVSQRDG